MTNRANYNPLLVKDALGRRRFMCPGVYYPEEKTENGTTCFDSPTPPPHSLTTEAVAERLQMTPRSVRSMMARHAIMPTAWHRAHYWPLKAIEKLEAAQLAKATSVPRGYIRSKKALLMLMCSPSTLNRYVNAGLLHPLKFRMINSNRVHKTFLYKESDVKKLVARIKAKREIQQQNRVARYIMLYSDD